MTAFDPMSEIRRLFPRASQSVIDLNSQLQDPQLKHPLPPALGGAKKRETKSNGRAHVRITAYTVRPRDSDNLAGGCKHLIDCLREIGLIRNDDPASITLEVGQKKVDSFIQEKTLLQITHDDP